MFRWYRALWSGRVLSTASTARLSTRSFAICPPNCPGGPDGPVAEEYTTRGWHIIATNQHPDIRIADFTGIFSVLGFNSTDLYVPQAQMTVIFLNNALTPVFGFSVLERLTFGV
jgi:hypothetical protein